jgi:hypothetical protein
MNAVAERGLVEATESTLFIYPAVHGLSQDLGIPGLRGRVTKVSHPLANLCGDARFSEREADAMIEKVRQRYGDLAFGWLTGPSTRPGDLPSRLEAAGLQHIDSIAGMALTDLAHPMDVDPKIRVREVNWPEAVGRPEERRAARRRALLHARRGRVRRGRFVHRRGPRPGVVAEPQDKSGR